MNGGQEVPELMLVICRKEGRGKQKRGVEARGGRARKMGRDRNSAEERRGRRGRQTAGGRGLEESGGEGERACSECMILTGKLPAVLTIEGWKSISACCRR